MKLGRLWRRWCETISDQWFTNLSNLMLFLHSCVSRIVNMRVLLSLSTASVYFSSISGFRTLRLSSLIHSQSFLRHPSYPVRPPCLYFFVSFFRVFNSSFFFPVGSISARKRLGCPHMRSSRSKTCSASSWQPILRWISVRRNLLKLFGY